MSPAWLVAQLASLNLRLKILMARRLRPLLMLAVGANVVSDNSYTFGGNGNIDLDASLTRCQINYCRRLDIR